MLRHVYTRWGWLCPLLHFCCTFAPQNPESGIGHFTGKLLPQAGDDEDDEEGGRLADARSQKSLAGRTARASEWGHTAVFSDEGDEEGETGGPK